MTPDVVIAGGGLAGAAAALELAQAGRSVVLFEKSNGPHDKVCGEFLSDEACRYLDRLGVAPSQLGSVDIDHVRLVRGRHSRLTKLPFAAASLSRRVLDEALLTAAIAAGAEVHRGLRVSSLARTGSNWRATLDTAETLDARHAILATGKHDLKTMKRPPGKQPDLIGFKTYWRLTETEMQALGATVELVLFDGGYAGLQPVDDNRANLCLLVHQHQFEAAGRSWPSLLARLIAQSPHLAKRLRGADGLTDRALAIAAIPYGYVAGNRDGPWCLGDQMAVIPSFSGDGMSIALHSASMAVRFLLAGDSSGRYHAEMRRTLKRQISRATWLSRAMVSSESQRAAFWIAKLVPGAMSLVARQTRIAPASVADVMSDVRTPAPKHISLGALKSPYS